MRFFAAAVLLSACVVHTLATNSTNSSEVVSDFDTVDVNSEYVRLPITAVGCVAGFPLLLCLCCVAACMHGCLKNDYEDISAYKNSEDEGLIDVVFTEPKLGLVMKEGLVTDVDASTSSKYDVRIKDRMWRIDGEKVSALKGKELIQILIAHEHRPIKIQFLRPSQTNTRVRTGIIKQETKNLTVLTTGSLKGIEPYNSMMHTNNVQVRRTVPSNEPPSHELPSKVAPPGSAAVVPHAAEEPRFVKNYMQVDGPPPLPPPSK